MSYHNQLAGADVVFLWDSSIFVWVVVHPGKFTKLNGTSINWSMYGLKHCWVGNPHILFEHKEINFSALKTVSILNHINPVITAMLSNVNIHALKYKQPCSQM